MFAVGCCVVLTATGCAFHGLNSLPLPGAVGRGPGANIYHVELPNVGTMESNSPVMIDDVVVGSVGTMTVQGWHADVEVSVKRDVVVPANVVATVGSDQPAGVDACGAQYAAGPVAEADGCSPVPPSR